MLIKRIRSADSSSTYEAMQSFTASRTADTRDELWLCEHPPVFTLGLASKPEHLLATGDIPVVQTNRGGQVTYHGPGQVVAYPLVDLKRLNIYVKEYVYRLEQAIIQTLASYGVEGLRVKGAPGIYVQALSSYPHPSPPPLGEGTESLSDSLSQRGRARVGVSMEQAATAYKQDFRPSALPAELLAHARELRSQLTDAEQLLWSCLRSQQLGAKFRKQHPMPPYILDFYCVEKRVALELDGGQHAQSKQLAYDEQRTKYLRENDVTVLRFWNNEVLTNIEGVLTCVSEALARRPPPQPSPAGGGRNQIAALDKAPPQPSPAGGGSNAFTGLAKIAALGIKVSRGCAYHGVALNVAMDLEPFSRINPCGYEGLKTVNLATLGVNTSWEEAAQRLAERLNTHLS